MSIKTFLQENDFELLSANSLRSWQTCSQLSSETPLAHDRQIGQANGAAIMSQQFQ
jgi:hypothetical protein